MQPFEATANRGTNPKHSMVADPSNIGNGLPGPVEAGHCLYGTTECKKYQLGTMEEDQ